MLTRIYIDNFRCFVNFEHKPARKQLILGRNGSGKSSYLDALLFVRQFVTKGDVFEDFFILSQRTRWLKQQHQTCELAAERDGGRYLYHLVIEPWGEPARPRGRRPGFDDGHLARARRRDVARDPQPGVGGRPGPWGA